MKNPRVTRDNPYHSHPLHYCSVRNLYHLPNKVHHSPSNPLQHQNQNQMPQNPCVRSARKRYIVYFTTPLIYVVAHYLTTL